MKTAVIYTRVSTENQRDNTSLADQEQRCRDYAAQYSMCVVDHLSDVESGNDSTRSGYTKLRSLVLNRAVDAIIVLCVDRLSRNVAHYHMLLEDLEAQGVELHYADRGQVNFDEEIRADEFEALLGQAERKRIARRLRRGQERKVKGSGDTPGRILGHGTAPYGYRFVGRSSERSIEIVPEEAAIVRRIYRLYLQGVSLRAIAEQFTAEQVPTPHDSGRYASNGKRMRGRCVWHQMIIWRVLRRDIYSGILYHYRATRSGKHGKLLQRDRSEWVGVPVPPIIDQATFQAVQQRLSLAQQRSQRNRKHFYLLGGGRLVCQCGHRMSGTASPPARPGQPHRRYYRCLSNRRDAVTPCTLPRINADHLEQVVWRWLETVLTAEYIERGVWLAEQQAEGERADVDENMATLEKRRAQYAHEHDRMIQAYKAGVLSLDELAHDKADNDAALQRVDEELQRLDQLRHTATTYDLAALQTAGQELRAQLPYLEGEERLHLLDLLGLEVVREVDAQGQAWVRVCCKLVEAHLPAHDALCHTARQEMMYHSPA
jgi:site-specific DNA recombinase